MTDVTNTRYRYFFHVNTFATGGISPLQIPVHAGMPIFSARRSDFVTIMLGVDYNA